MLKPLREVRHRPRVLLPPGRHVHSKARAAFKLLGSDIPDLATVEFLDDTRRSTPLAVQHALEWDILTLNAASRLAKEQYKAEYCVTCGTMIGLPSSTGIRQT